MLQAENQDRESANSPFLPADKPVSTYTRFYNYGDLMGGLLTNSGICIYINDREYARGSPLSHSLQDSSRFEV